MSLLRPLTPLTPPLPVNQPSLRSPRISSSAKDTGEDGGRDDDEGRDDHRDGGAELHTEPTPVPAEHLPEHRTLATSSLRKYFETAIKFEASDLLLRGGQKAKLRIRGALKALDTPPIDPEEFEREIESSLSPTHADTYANAGSLDLGVDFKLADE